MKKRGKFLDKLIPPDFIAVSVDKNEIFPGGSGFLIGPHEFPENTFYSVPFDRVPAFPRNDHRIPVFVAPEVFQADLAVVQ